MTPWEIVERVRRDAQPVVVGPKECSALASEPTWAVEAVQRAGLRCSLDTTPDGPTLTVWPPKRRDEPVSVSHSV